MKLQFQLMICSFFSLSDSHRAIFERSLGRSAVKEMKNKRQCLIPGEDELKILLPVYEDAIRNRCQYLNDSICMQEHLLDSFCTSDGLTSGVFSCSKYPWVLATPDIATFMAEKSYSVTSFKARI